VLALQEFGGLDGAQLEIAVGTRRTVNRNLDLSAQWFCDVSCLYWL
jgi:hypothetical protein